MDFHEFRKGEKRILTGGQDPDPAIAKGVGQQEQSISKSQSLNPLHFEKRECRWCPSSSPLAKMFERVNKSEGYRQGYWDRMDL
jgi:hypothetical protein